MSHIAIIGSGLAGLSMAAKLRSLNFDGAITMFGDEKSIPYGRPALSKWFLQGKKSERDLQLKSLDFFKKNDISLRTNCAVQAIDCQAQTLTLADGSQHSYDQLALTTGAKARQLPKRIGGELDGVLSLRTIEDATKIISHFNKARSVLVIGGGYIGLEIAASARQKDIEVTILEAAPRILHRVTCEQTSDYLRALHQLNGVKIIENARLSTLLCDENGKVCGGALADESTIEADCVIVGIGSLPNCALAQQAGLKVDSAIITNAYGKTSNNKIFAAGDCACVPLNGQQVRLENVQNAIDQANICAQNMLGYNVKYDPKPWFWSNQYDAQLQIAGLNIGYDKIVTRNSEKDGGVSFWYYAKNRLIAAESINDARSYSVAKKLIEAGKSPNPDLIANSKTDLKALLI